MRHTKEMIGKGTRVGYMMKKYHPELAAKEGHAAMVNAVVGAAARQGEEMAETVKRLVPDPERAKAVLNLAETILTEERLASEAVKDAMRARKTAEKVARTKGRGHWKDVKAAAKEVKAAKAAMAEGMGTGTPSKIIGTPGFIKQYAALTRNEKELFRTFRQVLSEREQALIKAELLTRDRAAMFIVRSGMNYVPHLLMTPSKRFNA